MPFRQAFVITTEPLRILSWDKSRIALQVVSIPSDILISGAFGYGQYSLVAMRTLDTMDHKNGQLLSESVAQAVGVPITGTIITESQSSDRPVLESLKKIFSWRSIGVRIVGRIGTTVSLSDWIHLVFMVHALGTDDIEVLNLTSAVNDLVRPDGTTVHVLDSEKVDYIVGNTLHDARLRNENKTVTIINTTMVFGIGSKVARMINRFGIQVVSVGNEAQAITHCELATDNRTRSSLTYKFLKVYFKCRDTDVAGDSAVSDITIRLGSSIAELFDTRGE